MLLQAIEAGVSKAIDNTNELSVCKQQQVRVLQDEYFLKNETAADVVDTFSLVLKGDKAKTKVEIPKTEAQSVSLPNSSPSFKTTSIKTGNNLSNFKPTHIVKSLTHVNCLGLRDIPNPDFNAFIQIPNGKKVQLLETGDKVNLLNYYDGKWYKITTKEGVRGWCFSGSLQKI